MRDNIMKYLHTAPVPLLIYNVPITIIPLKKEDTPVITMLI